MKAAFHVSDDGPSVFSGASILPTQYHGQRHDHRFEGERNLLFAILDDAVKCYLDYCEDRSILKRINYVEANDWIYSDKDRGPFSFVNLCETLGIDYQSLRRGLRRQRARRRAAVASRSGSFRPSAPATRVRAAAGS